MIPDEYADLINLLDQRTREAKVRWSQTGSSHTFAVHFDELTLTIEQHTDFEEPSEVFVRIYDENGEQIDSLWIGRGEEGFRQLTDLHDRARRSALRIDEVLGKIIRRLESGDEVGKSPPSRPADVDEALDGDDDLPF